MQSEIYLKWESRLPGNYRYLALLLTYWFIIVAAFLFYFSTIVIFILFHTVLLFYYLFTFFPLTWYMFGRCLIFIVCSIDVNTDFTTAVLFFL